MTIELDIDTYGIDRRADEPTLRARAAAPAIVRVTGLVASVVGLVAWLGWLSWRVGAFEVSAINLVVLTLELVAFAASLVVSAGLWVARPPSRRNRRSTDSDRQLPVLLAEALDLGQITEERSANRPVGDDDTGEIAWARRGIRVLGEQRRLDTRTKLATHNLREAAWSIVALDGLRRLCSVVVLLVVLFTGATPFGMPPTDRVVLLGAGISLVAIGNWLSSGGHVRPGARLLWSMASIGAGLGDGISRSGLPIRWVMTMATLVVLNLAVALRGMSDRWTHGLEPMDRDPRIVAMSVAVGLVLVGGLALRRMPRPDLGFYGATRRLEEDSVRRLALGLTLAVAAIGFVAGVLPADAVDAAVITP